MCGRYYAPLTAYARLFLNGNWAQDVVQDVFVNVWVAAPGAYGGYEFCRLHVRMHKVRKYLQIGEPACLFCFPQGNKNGGGQHTRPPRLSGAPSGDSRAKELLTRTFVSAN